MIHPVAKYVIFIISCVSVYFRPITFLLEIVVVMFIADFVTGIIKSRKTHNRWTLQSRKLRWSFVKMFVYLCVIALTFYVCESMQFDYNTIVTIVKIEIWTIVYIEGLSIIENLLTLFPDDKFLKVMHSVLSVELLRHLPLLSKHFKEREDGED